MFTTALRLETLGHAVCPSLANVSLRTQKASPTASLRRATFNASRRPPSAPRIQRAHQSSAAKTNDNETANNQETREPSSTRVRNSLRHAARLGEVEKAHHILTDLFCVKKKDKPSLQDYAAAILINCDARLGSAGATAALLKEIAELGFEPNSEICHNVLKVGASRHPLSQARLTQ
ncbi:hypothetical protein BKA81DRAFT_376113 [Phyllosticta paracitricarpa]